MPPTDCTQRSPIARTTYSASRRHRDGAARDPQRHADVRQALGHGHWSSTNAPGIPSGPWATMRPLPFGEQPAGAVWRRGDATPDVLDLATGSMVNLSLFPNLIFVGNQLMVIDPVAVDRTRLHLYLVLAPDADEEVDLLRLRVDEDFVSFGTPDDLAMFERIQEGLSIPELEWIDISRGLGAANEGAGDDDGLPTGPITSEGPQRAYLAEWKRLLEPFADEALR